MINTNDFLCVWFQQNGQMPHIKLDYVNGDIHQKLIFAQSPNEITVEAHECVIFNDGSKSSGCSRQEYRAYVSTSLTKKMLCNK